MIFRKVWFKQRWTLGALRTTHDVACDIPVMSEQYLYHQGHLCDLPLTITAPFARQTSGVRLAV